MASYSSPLFSRCFALISPRGGMWDALFWQQQAALPHLMASELPNQTLFVSLSCTELIHAFPASCDPSPPSLLPLRVAALHTPPRVEACLFLSFLLARLPGLFFLPCTRELVRRVSTDAMDRRLHALKSRPRAGREGSIVLVPGFACGTPASTSAYTLSKALQMISDCISIHTFVL